MTNNPSGRHNQLMEKEAQAISGVKPKALNQAAPAAVLAAAGGAPSAWIIGLLSAVIAVFGAFIVMVCVFQFELRGDIAAARAEMKEGLAEVKAEIAEIKTELAAVKKDIDWLKSIIIPLLPEAPRSKKRAGAGAGTETSKRSQTDITARAAPKAAP